jgi:hypothetical protein
MSALSEDPAAPHKYAIANQCCCASKRKFNAAALQSPTIASTFVFLTVMVAEISKMAPALRNYTTAVVQYQRCFLAS